MPRFTEEFDLDGPSLYSQRTDPTGEVDTARDHDNGRFVQSGKGSIPIWLNTRNLISHFRYGPYIFIPILAALTWFSGLTALLALWVYAGKPRYSQTEAKIAFISDVGGAHESFFLALCCVVDILYFSSVCAIKWLRYNERLPKASKSNISGNNGSKLERNSTDDDLEEYQDDQDESEKSTIWSRIRPTVQSWASWLAIVFCLLGCIGLFILAKWNAFDYPDIHWDGTLIFVLGVALSAMCQTTEVWLLRVQHPHRRHLVVNSYVKLGIVTISVICALVFASTYEYCGGKGISTNTHTTEDCDRVSSIAAIFEWSIAFLLNGYFLTLSADLWPSGKTSSRWRKRLDRWNIESK